MNSPRDKVTSFSISAVLFLFFAMGVFKSDVFGQSYVTFRSELTSVREGTKYRIGPFFLSPSLQFTTGYDSNIYGAPGEITGASDYVLEISLPVTVFLPFRNWLILSLTEQPQYVYFFTIERERSFNNSYSPAFRLLLLNRFVLSGSYQFRRAKSRFLLEVEQRIFEQIQGYGGSLFCETARGSSIGLSSSIRKYSYEDVLLPGQEFPLSVAMDREERNSAAEFYYRLFSETFSFVHLGRTEYAFNRPESFFKNSHSYQFHTGIRFSRSARVTGVFSLGYKKFSPKDKALVAFSGLVGNTEVSLRLGRLNLRFEFVRDVPFSYLVDNIFFIETRLGIGSSFYLNRFLRLDYGFSYGRGVYPQGVIVEFPGQPPERIEGIDIYRLHRVGLTLRVMRNTGIGINVNYSDRTSNYYRNDIQRFFVGVNLIYDF